MTYVLLAILFIFGFGATYAWQEMRSTQRKQQNAEAAPASSVDEMVDGEFEEAAKQYYRSATPEANAEEGVRPEPTAYDLMKGFATTDQPSAIAMMLSSTKKPHVFYGGGEAIPKKAKAAKPARRQVRLEEDDDGTTG